MVTVLSSKILYFYINAMLELHSYITHVTQRRCQTGFLKLNTKYISYQV